MSIESKTGDSLDCIQQFFLLQLTFKQGVGERRIDSAAWLWPFT